MISRRQSAFGESLSGVRWSCIFGCFLLVVWGAGWGCTPAAPPLPDGTTQDGGGGVDTVTQDTGAPDQVKPPACTSDADCTDPAKPKCINNVCDGIPGVCASDADCTDPAKPSCVGGQCIAPCGCQSDSDCPSDAPICQSCQCVRPIPPQCTVDADCKDPTQSKCLNGSCVGCIKGEDCANGQTCNNGKCEPLSNPCKSDADCKDPNNPNCVNGTCVAASPECKSDADCKDPNIPKCDNGTCVPGPTCQSDTDCKDPSRGQCVGGQCVPACTTNADCKAPGLGKCSGGQCVAECNADADCTDPNRPLCQTGTCTPKAGCKTEKDCATSSVGSHCELSSGKCVACVIDTHCKSFEVCDTKSYTCAPKPGACNTDKECPKTAPHCVNNTCSICRDNKDCQRLESCVAGVCKLTGCNADADCAPEPTNKYCNPKSKQCVLCTQDSHCPAVSFCDVATSTCQQKPACASNADCKAPVPYCEPTSKVCVACLADNQCKNDPNANGAARCTNNACIGCSADKDCNLGYLCNSGTCVEGCLTNRDCPTSAKICSTTLKKCVECAANADCSGSDVCDLTTNKCSYRCTVPNNYDAGCASRRLPVYCDGTTRTCVACIPVTFSSATNIDRGCNSALPKCEPTTRKCVLCREDKDCSASAGAISATCDKTTNTCSECTKQSDCRRNYVCNTQTKQCISGCLLDADCPRGKICGDSNQCTDCSTKNPTCAPGLVCHGKSGQCVACLKDSDCKTGEKCDLSSYLCLGTTGRPQCAPCAQDSECATNHNCIKTRVDTTNNVSESVCLQKCTQDSDCGRGFTCCSATNNFCNTRTYPERANRCYPNYTRAGSLAEGYATWISCKAILTQGQSCSVSGYATTCGHGAIGSGTTARGDSICEDPTRVCRTPCRNANECLVGYVCQCPAGLTNRNGYCYQGNSYAGPQRCVK